MKALIVGLGSIGRKHLHALRKINPDVEILALRSRRNDTIEEGVYNVYSWNEVPEDIKFILICNPTSEHLSTIQSACKFGVPLFIEKPPLMGLTGADELLQLLDRYNISTYTAFNLRFHPVVKWLKQHLVDRRVVEVTAYCGSYLPDWRPGLDFRESYSANRELGGGVHLDLIHELDYLRWMFGNPIRSFASFSKVSDLEIQSVDSAHYWLEYKDMVISVILNYYRRDAKRTIEIVMNEETWNVDLLRGAVTNSRGEELFKTAGSVLDTYVEQMAYFLTAIQQPVPMMNSLRESIETLKLCIGNA